MKRSFPIGARLALAGAALLVAIAACGDPTGPAGDLGNFLIRTPTDPLTSAPPLVRASASAHPDTVITFEWTPAKGADRYTVVFLRAPNAVQMDTIFRHIVEGTDRDTLDRQLVDSPTLAFEVNAPQEMDIRIGVEPGEGEVDSRPVFRVVRHGIPQRDMAAAMNAAGLPASGSSYFVWTVVAHRGSASARSIEVQRLNILRVP